MKRLVINQGEQIAAHKKQDLEMGVVGGKRGFKRQPQGEPQNRISNNIEILWLDFIITEDLMQRGQQPRCIFGVQGLQGEVDVDLFGDIKSGEGH